jgi:hypothetical protein
MTTAGETREDDHGRRIRRKRRTWPWVLLVLFIVALIWLLLIPGWQGERVYQAPPGTDVRDLKPEPAPNPDPGSLNRYDQPAGTEQSRPEE